MATITFTSPLGEDKLDPTAEFLKEVVFNQGEEFWQAGSEQASIDFDEESPKSYLWLKKDEDAGFMLEHGFRDGSYELFTLRHGEITDKTIEASIGGEPASYHRSYFVSKEIAWKAIEYFMESGERHPDLIWEIAEMPEE